MLQEAVIASMVVVFCTFHEVLEALRQDLVEHGSVTTADEMIVLVL